VLCRTSPHIDFLAASACFWGPAAGVVDAAFGLGALGDAGARETSCGPLAPSGGFFVTVLCRTSPHIDFFAASACFLGLAGVVEAAFGLGALGDADPWGDLGADLDVEADFGGAFVFGFSVCCPLLREVEFPIDLFHSPTQT
jgi:hypothetical protein